MAADIEAISDTDVPALISNWGAIRWGMNAKAASDKTPPIAPPNIWVNNYKIKLYNKFINLIEMDGEKRVHIHIEGW